MDKISIGLLLPSSTIFPIAKEFEKGLNDGLKLIENKNIEVDLIKEFIGSGDIKLTENACNKFFNYDDVDLVTGIISNRAAAVVLSERFRTQKKTLLLNNLGAHIPAVADLNEYIFINSMHLWQHAYSLGHWGASNFGNKGMYISAVYEAGYGFPQMFHMGMLAVDPEYQWCFSVPPMPPAGTLTDMSIIFPFIEEYKPDFIFAGFCGAETTLFLNEFIKRGFHHKIKVLGLPYLLAPFAPLDEDITIYTTLPFENAPEISSSKVFYHLGQQTGEAISKAIVKANSKSELRDQMAALDVFFNVGEQKNNDVAATITIMQNDIKANETTFNSTKLAQWETFGLNTTQMAPLTAGVGSGWYNPYLCI